MPKLGYREGRCGQVATRCGRSQLAATVSHGRLGKLSLRRGPHRGPKRPDLGRGLQLLALSPACVAGRILSARSSAHIRRHDSLRLGGPDDRHSPLPNLRLRNPLADTRRRLREGGGQRALARRIRRKGSRGQENRQRRLTSPFPPRAAVGASARPQSARTRPHLRSDRLAHPPCLLGLAARRLPELATVLPRELRHALVPDLVSCDAWLKALGQH